MCLGKYTFFLFAVVAFLSLLIYPSMPPFISTSLFIVVMKRTTIIFYPPLSSQTQANESTAATREGESLFISS